MGQYRQRLICGFRLQGARAIESESVENQEYIIKQFIENHQDIVLVDSYTIRDTVV